MKKSLRILISIFILAFCFITLSSCSSSKKQVKIIDISLSSEKYAFAIKKGSSLKKNVNDFLLEKKDEIDKIFDKYLNATKDELETFGDSSIATASTNRKEELVVATNLDFAPFEYLNGAKIAGIDMEIAKMLADYLNKRLVVINMDFEAVITSVQNIDLYDIGMAGLTITDERAEVIDFSDAYFDVTQVLIVNSYDKRFDDCKTSDDVTSILKSLKGNDAKCGGQAGTTSQFYVEGNEGLGFEGYSNLEFHSYSSAAMALKDMKNGNTSFILTDMTTANAIVMDGNSSNIEKFNNSFFDNGGYKVVLNGLKATAMIALFSFIIGIFFGTLLACIKLSSGNNKVMYAIKKIVDIYLMIFRGTPIVVQLLVIYYVLLPSLGLHFDNLAVAIITFGLNSAAYIAEIMRGGILSVDKGQTEGGRSLALSYPTTMLTIVFPQALKNSLPTLGNELITLIKDTSVVSFIAVTDLTLAFKNIGSSTYEYTIPYLMLALTYLVIVLALTGIIRLLERWLRRSER